MNWSRSTNLLPIIGMSLESQLLWMYIEAIRLIGGRDGGWSRNLGLYTWITNWAEAELEGLTMKWVDWLWIQIITDDIDSTFMLVLHDATSSYYEKWARSTFSLDITLQSWLSIFSDRWFYATLTRVEANDGWFSQKAMHIRNAFCNRSVPENPSVPMR